MIQHPPRYGTVITRHATHLLIKGDDGQWYTPTFGIQIAAGVRGEPDERVKLVWITGPSYGMWQVQAAEDE